VFLERGVTRATLDEIARAAGITRGAIYWHFRDKLEIFLALERRAKLPNEELGGTLKARLAADPRLDPLDELAERRSILTILWMRSEYVYEVRPVLTHQRRADAALRELFETVIGLAAARGRVAPIWPPNTAARALLLFINGAVADWLREPGEGQLVTLTTPMVSAFLEAVGLPRAPVANG
jgi:AcrR family transcriptional regulator